MSYRVKGLLKATIGARIVGGDMAESYQMPVAFGPRAAGVKISGWYRDVTSMIVSYKTDREKLQNLLPSTFEVDSEPTVTVVYACNKNIDWLAGHGYNLVGVYAGVKCQVNGETKRGSFALVIWENLADPILTGRELQGIPKIYAEIPEHQCVDGRWSVAARHFGNQIVALDIAEVRDPRPEEIAQLMAAGADKNNSFAQRYMPGIGGRGTSINESVIYHADTQYKSLKVGVGKVIWPSLTWEQNPTQFHIVNALADLPILGYETALVVECATNLIVPEKPTEVFAVLAE